MNIIKGHMVASLYFHFKWLLKKRKKSNLKRREKNRRNVGMKSKKGNLRTLMFQIL